LVGRSCSQNTRPHPRRSQSTSECGETPYHGNCPGVAESTRFWHTHDGPVDHPPSPLRRQDHVRLKKSKPRSPQRIAEDWG
jgi:hypothetical protein